MADALHYLRSIFFAWAMLNPVLGSDTFRSSYVKLFESCSLAEATNQTMLDSVDCKYECLAKQDSGSCAAYQWDADTNTCHLQETLNVTVSSSDTVGVLMDTDETTACSDDTDCPLNHTCQITNTDCGILSASCVCADCPADCAEIRAANSYSQSGIYTVYIGGTQHIQKVWCDMDTDGGGWTVFLKRQDGSVDFYQDLAAYKQGFGDVRGEYWLGLDVLYAMTSAKTYQLRADISDWEGFSAYSLYHFMVVAGESDNYTLTVGAFTAGGGGDGLLRFYGMGFSTKDADRDRSSYSCATKHHGGFWYKHCMQVNPTGQYYHGGVYTNTVNDGIQWRTWSKHYESMYSMKTVELKLRP